MKATAPEDDPDVTLDPEQREELISKAEERRQAERRAQQHEYFKRRDVWPRR